MCGIAGFYSNTDLSKQDPRVVVLDMARQLKHRGPDDEGVWVDQKLGLALAHRRLSIVDLTAAGHQPMVSPCGRFVMVFNGEIYNHEAIRQEIEVGLKGSYSWLSRSDTETLLVAISIWGFRETLCKVIGMFSIAVWDRDDEALYLARDRFGEKPLYIGFHGGVFLFASELKAMRAYPGFRGQVDRDALSMYLDRGMIPAPYSIYQGISKLLPGTFIRLTKSDIQDQYLPEPSQYWSLSEVVLHGQSNQFQGGVRELVDELERLLTQSVASQMMADVPVGAFLSGGIDSSIIVALMQQQSIRPINTFTIGFPEVEYDESSYARSIAKHLGTEHLELFVTSKELQDVIPRLPRIYDEPFADASQIPTYLIAKMASAHVKVCLTGDGGDELFGGYNRYINGPNLWGRLELLPYSIRKTLSNMIKSTPAYLLGEVFSKVGNFKMLNHRMAKISQLLLAKDIDEIYTSLVNQSGWSAGVVLGTSDVIASKNQLNIAIKDIEHKMMFMDATTYLSDDLLVKLDRAAMTSSLETRAPMLDVRLVEFAWSLPITTKIRDGRGKLVMRQLLDRHIPNLLINRPKSGFSVPLGLWLRGPLKEWANHLLDPQLLKKQNFFDVDEVSDKWKQHLSNKRDWSNQLWSVLMFQAWLMEEGCGGEYAN